MWMSMHGCKSLEAHVPRPWESSQPGAQSLDQVAQQGGRRRRFHLVPDRAPLHCHRVAAAPEHDRRLCWIAQEVGRPPVAVARLADAPYVDHQALRADREHPMHEMQIDRLPFAREMSIPPTRISRTSGRPCRNARSSLDNCARVYASVAWPYWLICAASTTP